MPVFWANDAADPVIPRDLVARSEAWLRDESGATLHEHHYAGMGHSISRAELVDLNAFVAGVIAA